MKKACMLAAMCVLLCGCGLMGPTPVDVKKALDAVGSGLTDSGKYNPQISSEYSNAADITAVAPDGSVANRAKVYIDSAHALLIHGECTFANYKESTSGYVLNGTVTYKFEDIKKDDPGAMIGNIACDVTLTGGKIQSLKVTVVKGKEGPAVTEIFANGKKFDIEGWENAMGMLKAVAPNAAP